MGKESRMQKKSTRKPKHLGSAVLFSSEKDLDDEVDAFHKQRDVIPLDINADAGYDLDKDIEHPVFEIEGADENDSNDSGDASSDDDEEDDDDDDCNDDNDDDVEDDGDIGDETRYTGFAAKIARQAKFLRQKIGGVEDDMHDDAEHEEERKVWGRRKGIYYSADNIDFELQSSDEDLPEEEEAEVLRLQKEKAKYLSAEDFGLKDADEDEGDSGGEQGKTLQDMLVEEKYITKSYIDGLPEDTDYEEVKKDLSALSKEEQMDVVYSSAPELVGLLSELNEARNQLQKVKPLLCKVKDQPHVTKGGLHYLEVKQLLLLAYCQAIAFYLLLKSEGHPVRDHPVIARLVEINKLLEKVKQIDVNLPLYIEEIANHDGIVPNKEVVKESAALDVSASVTNVSAKTRQVTPAHEMLELVKVGLSEDHDHTVANKKDQNGQVGLQSMEMLKVRARLEEKLKQRGIYSTMPPRPDRTQKHSLQSLNRRMETFTDFDDEITEFTKHGGMSNDHTNSSHSKKLSQLVAAKVNKPKFISGDEDLPKRDDIGERRRKYELRVLARANVGDEEDEDGLGTMSMDVDPQGDGALLESEDDLYKEVKRQRAAKLSTKAELYSRTPTVSTLPDPETDGKRHISYQMEKNKGLTRSRKKLTKIPRKKYKLKHKKAVVRRKGQVRDIRKPTGPYGGEASGINIRVSRSVRFKS